MLRFFKSLFGKRSEPVAEAPYKVEASVVIDTYQPVETPAAPEPVKCGCGRSATGFCVGLHKLSPAEWAAHPDNPAKPVAEAKPAAKAEKKSAAKKAPAKKESAKKKPAAMTAAKKTSAEPAGDAPKPRRTRSKKA